MWLFNKKNKLVEVVDLIDLNTPTGAVAETKEEALTTAIQSADRTIQQLMTSLQFHRNRKDKAEKLLKGLKK